MIDKLYLIITCLSIGLTFGMGWCFLLLKIPNTPNLDNYKIARKIMFSAYISLAAFYLIEIVSHPQTPNMQLTQTITIIVGSLQAFLFTYTFISLINLHFVNKQKIIAEVSIIALFAIILFATFISNSASYYFLIAFYAYIVYYVSMLIRYTIIFLREYRNYSNQLDNFFSEEEHIRFRWIRLSFFGALFIGIGALLITFSINSLHYIIFSLVFIGFYSYFGIKFIEYAYSFHKIEPILTTTETNNSLFCESSPDNNLLENNIKQWAQQEKYLEQGITIKQLAKELNTNRTYLSHYINNIEGKTFREWINDLRIEKSKEILLNSTNLSVSEIAGITGYSDSSNFNKQFVKNTGIPAGIWRTQNRHK